VGGYTELDPPAPLPQITFFTVEQIYLVQHTVQCRAVVLTAMNTRVSENAWKYLTSSRSFGSVQLNGRLVRSLVIQQSAPDDTEIATCQIDGEINVRPRGNCRK